MDNMQYDLLALLPEMVVLGMAMFILLLDLFILPQNRFIIYGLSQFTLLAAAFFTFKTHTPAVGFAFSHMFIDDTLSDVIKMMMYLGTSLILVYTRKYLQDRQLYRGEFYAMVLFGLLGMMIMVSGHNMLTIYIGLELLSLCLYSLVAFDRDNPRASEAAMKYFVLGALASGMLLYGMSMLYGMTGSLDVSDIANGIAQQTKSPVLILGLVFVVAGLAFKFGAVPFQMWVPDVYQGAPTPMTLLIGTVPKLAAYAMTVRLLVQGLHPLALDWQDMLVLMAVLSIIIGNFSAIVQTNLKRMLAYSTISHVGFIMFGMMSANANGFASSFFYISAYVLMSIAGFGIILLLSRQGFEAEEIDDLKGLNQRHPWFAFLMLIIMFSMAGIPPTIGFYAKFTVLQAAWQAGFTWQVVLAVLMATVGAFYYLNIVRKMYFDAPEDNTPLTAPIDMRFVLSVHSLALLGLGLFPEVLLSVCGHSLLISLQ
ncbi:NADH-quinone oxidoreductase subunit NuoN [Methylophilus medardicus]|uniref:NADH-quinone oxidoreductase subunit N n=1 Tax=Methylophilus medardicus TaxID=2588534 RepID=A0A5B8CRC6_9PROT|nr:NADH-quinone oxidoreductase subunit NuoN [Methylophilus medardicus]QDC43818.1 NADH-quinone oxidoreductase subunit NuoN [Methylophilus medardicus]QDC48825.1 NADH-quinone oxidoreductase subunit NuoN [Methylophilus medardicus]QDC52530.1 NADH-quinone oxidoreductase subunit NuoN [Methylophilus medardicus]